MTSKAHADLNMKPNLIRAMRTGRNHQSTVAPRLRRLSRHAAPVAVEQILDSSIGAVNLNLKQVSTGALLINVRILPAAGSVEPSAPFAALAEDSHLSRILSAAALDEEDEDEDLDDELDEDDDEDLDEDDDLDEEDDLEDEDEDEDDLDEDDEDLDDEDEEEE